jgi:hypothetical protein
MDRVEPVKSLATERCSSQTMEHLSLVYPYSFFSIQKYQNNRLIVTEFHSLTVNFIYLFLVVFFRVGDPSQKENLGIIVQYKVKVKLCLGALGG